MWQTHGFLLLCSQSLATECEWAALFMQYVLMTIERAAMCLAVITPSHSGHSEPWEPGPSEPGNWLFEQPVGVLLKMSIST